ncbi:MAG: hypothetical protein RR654_03085 [Oscillospiraceae bacterium]
MITADKAQKSRPCIEKLKQKRGSVLIPAMFIMMFFVIMGSVLLRAGESSIIDATRNYAYKQAYYSAKSAVDVLCAEIDGKHQINDSTKQSLKNLASTIEVLTLNNSVASTDKMFGSEVTTTLTCIEQENPEPLLSIKKIRVSSTATYNNAKRTVNRDIEVKNTIGGVPTGIFGVANNNAYADYNINGAIGGSVLESVRFNGAVRIENARTFNMANVEVNGDLFINATDEVTLTNVGISGNLYIRGSGNKMTLKNVHILENNKGDISNAVIKSSGVLVLQNWVATSFTSGYPQMPQGNMYIKAPQISMQNNARLMAERLYLCGNMSVQGNGAIDKRAKVIRGEEANIAFAQEEIKTDKEAMDIKITQPTNCEIIGQHDVKKLTDAFPLDTSGYAQLNYELDGSLPMLDKIEVEGNGTVNFFVKASGIFKPDFYVDRVDGLSATVNFIILDTTRATWFQLSNLEKTFKANLIIPWGEIYMTNSTIEGATMAAMYRLAHDNKSATLINSQVPWAQIGDLNIGLGSLMETTLQNYS